MAKRTSKQMANHLLTVYSRLYAERLGSKPSFSRYAEQWGMVGLLEDYDEQFIYSVLEYYFTLNRSEYELRSFYLKFHELVNNREEAGRRRTERLKLLEQTKRLVEKHNDHKQ